jgi:cytidine deaminase
MSAAVPPELLEELVKVAKEARRHAYAPYSRYHVGAALATKSGRVFAGCNVENASYGACLCAERTAVGQMVAAGEREPVACVIVTKGPRAASPCGICRQVLSEMSRDMVVVLVGETDDGTGSETGRRQTTLAALLPDAFEGSQLPE